MKLHVCENWINIWPSHLQPTSCQGSAYTGLFVFNLPTEPLSSDNVGSEFNIVSHFWDIS